MSDMEHWVGKAKEYVFTVNRTFTEKIEFMKSRGHVIEDYYEGEEWFDCKTLVQCGGRWFEITEKKEYDNDICTASIGTDGEVSFCLNFYNGGCSFTTALMDAIEEAEPIT